MRINTVQLAHALAKSQSLIRATSVLKFGTNTVSESNETSSPKRSSAESKKTRKKRKSSPLNIYCGLHVDEWV